MCNRKKSHDYDYFYRKINDYDYDYISLVLLLIVIDFTLHSAFCEYFDFVLFFVLDIFILHRTKNC